MVMQGFLSARPFRTGTPGNYDGDTAVGVRVLQKRLGVPEMGSFDERT
ncbi:MAG: hypothetical protein UY98_C0024G0005 [Candidatus Kaiserbacteria bacterium GW2011_GWA2_58_9]|uniref:Peptidoglycan binding-like domain-containing protein n=1 Tax=Candidatus Kaiserbacteria bacterium GW2011_GWA2_58_9 TaxID=1618672 RepID=A0A0G1YUQ5_9BACT|nr:MAG: hypothetical protein UY98_C0024G0005 [Candidatus Kaiserbacteria bacterium GW2011_GWA2_58_9]